MPQSASQRLVDLLARWGALVLWLAVVIGLFGGVASALLWSPSQSFSSATPAVDPCPSPPCFGDGTLPRLIDLPVVLPVIGFMLATLLGAPSLLVGVWDLMRKRLRLGAWRVLAFFGPLFVLVGMEVIPHVLNPCLVMFLLGSEAPGLCQGDVSDRWHALSHALIGGLPLVLLYTRIRGMGRDVIER
jgi:hypothetical protein